MNFKFFLFLLLVNPCSVFSKDKDEELSMLAKGLDFSFHPITAGFLSIFAVYAAKKEPRKANWIIGAAIAVNGLGFINDCYILNSIQGKNNDEYSPIKTNKQKEKDQKGKDADFPLFFVGQLTQVVSLGINSYYFYQSRNFYTNKEFWSLIGCSWLAVFGRLLQRSNIKKED